MVRILCAFVGAALGFVFLTASGFLSVQISGLMHGAIYDLRNVVVAVTDPGLPIAHILALGALSGLAVLVILVSRRSLERSARAWFLTGFSLTVLGCSVTGMSLYASRDTSAQLSGVIPEGIPGWVERGAMESSVHVVLIIALAATVLAFTHTAKQDARPDVTRSGSPQTRSTSTPPEQEPSV